MHGFGQPKKKTIRLDGIPVQTSLAHRQVTDCFAAVPSRIPATSLNTD